MESWDYEKLIGSGATSYVFKGKWNGKDIALKWMNKKHADRELVNICAIQDVLGKAKPKTIKGAMTRLRTSHLLLPLCWFCGQWFMEDIVGPRIPAIDVLRGPRLIKDRKTKQHKLEGTGKDLQSCLLLYPLMDGDLETANLALHSPKIVLKDLRSALTHLSKAEPPIKHEDLALRNIFYFQDKDGKTHYLLGDFGKISFQDYAIDQAMLTIASKFLKK
jgi:hypothetical protein